MSPREHHLMTTELIAERQTMRYTCPTCQRCLEDGPEGITMIHRGDPAATHHGGNLFAIEHEVEQDTRGAHASSPPPPTLH